MIQTVPILNKEIAFNYSADMSPEQKINYLVQNLRYFLMTETSLRGLTGSECLDYRPFPFLKDTYDVLQDDFSGDGKAMVDILRRLHWDKQGISVEKYDISSLVDFNGANEEYVRKVLEANTHSIAIVNIDGVKYLVDCAYRQFFSKTDDATQSQSAIEEFMLQDGERRKLAEQLLQYGYIEATPENIKRYMDAFFYEAQCRRICFLPNIEEYTSKVKGDNLEQRGKLEHQYWIKDLWKLYIRGHYPDNSSETLGFINEHRDIFQNIKNNLVFSTASFNIVIIDEKRYLRIRKANGELEDIPYTKEALKDFLDGVLIHAAKIKNFWDEEEFREVNEEDIVLPTEEEYLKLYPCEELSLPYSNYIIESEPYIAERKLNDENYDISMPVEEKIDGVVQKERRLLAERFDIRQDSLAGECEDSTARVVMDCISKGFEHVKWFVPGKYTHYGVDGHNATLVFENGEGYLIDCTIRQFFQKAYSDKHCGHYMLQTEQGKKVAESLLTLGYVKATPENIKIYLDSFEMARRKSSKETEISAEEYMRRLTEDNTIQASELTSIQILEAAKSMGTEEIVRAGKLLKPPERIIGVEI